MLEVTADWIRAEAPAILVLLATLLISLGERRVHNYNYAYLTLVEGEELIPSLMKKYYRYTIYFPIFAFVSSAILPLSLVPLKATLLGLGLIMAGFLTRVWTMKVMGRLWSQRCIYIAEMPRENRGPFRFFKHPEYVARSIEGLGLVLFFGLNPFSILVWLRIVVLLSRIVKVESRQLHELSAAPLQLPNGSSRVGASKLR